MSSRWLPSLLLGLSFAGLAAAEEAATPPAEAPPAPTPEERKIAALKKRYWPLVARRDRLEEKIAELEERPEADEPEEEEEEGAFAKPGKRPGLQGAGSSSGGRPPSRRYRAGASADEQVIALEDSLEKLEEEITAIEREAAQLGLGSAGLMQGAPDRDAEKPEEDEDDEDEEKAPPPESLSKAKSAQKRSTSDE